MPTGAAGSLDAPNTHIMLTFASKSDDKIISQIVTRALEMAEKYGVDYDRMSCHMDISACHSNGCPLQLERMLNADDLNFAHDVFGIRKHIDRRTGVLTGHFLPRFARTY